MTWASYPACSRVPRAPGSSTAPGRGPGSRRALQCHSGVLVCPGCRPSACPAAALGQCSEHSVPRPHGPRSLPHSPGGPTPGFWPPSSLCLDRSLPACWTQLWPCPLAQLRGLLWREAGSGNSRRHSHKWNSPRGTETSAVLPQALRTQGMASPTAAAPSLARVQTASPHLTVSAG